MPITAGICAVAGRSVAGDLLAHITPVTGTVPTAVTITGPLKLAAYSATLLNTTTGTTGELTDANYTRQSISGWNAQSTTSGAGYNVGMVTQTNASPIVFGGSTGFAVGQNVAAYMCLSSDATPVETLYQNLSVMLPVPAGSQLTVALGALLAGIS